MSFQTPLPDGLELARTTPEFDEHTVPSGLLGAHRIAPGVWGLLRVRSGSLRFVFESAGDEPRTLDAGATQVIPPGELHHVDVDGPVGFVVEFHRHPAEGRDDTDTVVT